MKIVVNFVVHFSFLGFRQESSRDRKETTTGWILSNYLLPYCLPLSVTFYQVRPSNLCPQHGAGGGGGGRRGGGDGGCCYYLDTCQCWDGPGCLAPGRREDWALTESWPRCRPGQVSPAVAGDWRKLHGGGGGTIVTHPVSRLLGIYTQSTVNTQIMVIKTTGMFGDFLRHLADSWDWAHTSLQHSSIAVSHFLSLHRTPHYTGQCSESRLCVLQG